MGALRVRCPSQDKPVAAIHSVVSWRQSRLSLSLLSLWSISPATTHLPAAVQKKRVATNEKGGTMASKVCFMLACCYRDYLYSVERRKRNNGKA